MSSQLSGFPRYLRELVTDDERGEHGEHGDVA